MSARPLVLAAGAGTRLGRPKAACPVAGRPMLARVLASAAAAGLPPAIVVAGADPEGVRSVAAQGPWPAPELIVHAGWSAGRTSSLQAGLRALGPADEAFLLWPVDVCLVGPALVRALLAARAGSTPAARAWIPSHAGRRGHPALLASELAARFLALGVDAPAHEVVRGLALVPGALVHVAAGEECLIDIDTPADLARANAM